MEHMQKVTNNNHVKFDIHTLDNMEVERTFMFNLHIQTVVNFELPGTPSISLAEDCAVKTRQCESGLYDPGRSNSRNISRENRKLRMFNFPLSTSGSNRVC